ncbi:hypothetical protein [Paraburkholderia sp. BCC1884]|uniref:hypothetical protein n=1 Tax=Paraburkholderia sp. BCC1884 TaxID=2562668 RepID=UPI001181DC06|nr:hypothetical protein [Paraburkholderia sp. BCC1884]
MMTERKKPDLQEILLQFSVERGIPDASLLLKYVQKYPEYSHVLTEFAASLVKDSFADPKETAAPVDDLVVKAATARYQAYLARVEQPEETAAATGGMAENPLERLSREQFSGLAQYLKVPLPFVSKLRDRAIQLESIPSAFIARLVGYLQLPESTIVSHLRAEPHLVGLAAIDVDGKIARERLSFSDGLRAVGLNSEQIKSLMDDLNSRNSGQVKP